VGPSAASDMQQYLRGIDYPAEKEEVASAAEGMGAPEHFVERIRGAPTERFGNPDEVMIAVQGSPQERKEV
jgi:Protein of unknown function (DUF2795)